MMKAVDNIRDVVLGYWRTLVVERKTVRLHIVEPYLIRSTTVRLREDKYCRTNTSVGFEDTARHRDNSHQLLIVDQFLTHCDVCLGRSEENTVWNDARTATTHLQRAHKLGKKE